jgi:cell division protein FtsI (penicillin-binding protein 3)
VLFICFNKPPYFIPTTSIKKDLALRGGIYSQDNFNLAINKKLYSVAIIPKYIDVDKLELLANLLSIYTNIPKQYFLNKIKQHQNRVVILKHIPYSIKKNLDYLSIVLDIKRVFRPAKNGIRYGLEIQEELSKREYPFKDRLEPVLGYARYNKKYQKFYGKIGLENYYNDALYPKQNGYINGIRDLKNRTIYDNEAIIKPRIDGDTLILNINFILQGKVENILDKFKKKLKAQEILAIVIDSKTGKVLSIASSNRYNPMHITQNDISKLKMDIVQYTYEPGSVMKPITLAMLLQHKKVNVYEVINAYNGVFPFKKEFIIYDDEKFEYLNVINALIHSSNIVFAQLGIRLTPSEFREGLVKFGFGQKSGIDLPYEHKGVLFSKNGLINPIHRASNSFGYALQVNLVQLVKAYNSFNNNGIMVTPKIVNKYADKYIKTIQTAPISPSTAQTILNILRKVVLQGTAKATNIDGLFIAGKTGTAKISINGNYQEGFYNSTFVGFANDNNKKYTIGVLVIKPSPQKYFASKTAVIVFKKIVETMLDMSLLHKQKI